MSDCAITCVTAKRQGFTVSSVANQWCVLRGATLEEVPFLFDSGEFLPFDNGFSQSELRSADGLVRVVTVILNSQFKPSIRWAALSRLMQAGLLLMPYEDGAVTALIHPGLTNSTKFTGAFLAACESILGNEQSPYVKTALAKLWLCTEEARLSPPTRKMLSDWVRFFLPVGEEKKGKWTEHINKATISALSHLGTLLGVSEVFKKDAPEASKREQLSHNTHFQHWQKAFDEWLDERHYGDVQKQKEAFEFLQQYWCAHPTLLDPELFFSSHVSRESIWNWTQKRGTTVSRARKLCIINQFIRAYVLKHPYLAIQDDWDGELILAVGYDWPLSNSDLTAISVYLGDSGKPAQSNQKSLPEPLLREVEIILTEDDMAWPKTRLCDWLHCMNNISGKYERVFCPTLPLLVRLLLKLPIRGIQARRLDSGEGDVLRFDLSSFTFVGNDSVHAGYWEKLPHIRNPRRGVLRKFHDEETGEDFCGFYINSNKTRDRRVLFSETSGYEIFWQHNEVIEIILQMRKWQETFNPVDGPLEFSRVPKKVFPEPSKTVEKLKPAVFYLFRYPGGNLNMPESPPTGQILRLYWYEVLAEVERRLAKRMTNPPKLIDSWDGDVPMSSEYHVHGLRLGGLTRLAKAGVHPWILQNIVAAHAGWVMTYYYFEPGFVFINDRLTEGYIAAMKEGQREFAQFLTECTIENVHKAAIRHSEDAIEDLQSARRAKSSFMMATLDDGACPNGQTRCDEGMKIIHMMDRNPKELRNAFGPVPFTVGGVRDCARCRFFITGTRFLIPMMFKCSAISVAVGSSVDRQQELMLAIDKSEKARIAAERAGGRLSIKESQDLQSLRVEYKTESDTLVDLIQSLDANVKYFQEIRAAMKENATSDYHLPILLTQEIPEFHWGLIHRFEAIDELCKGAKWFKSIRTESLANERLLSILKIYSREGRTPPLALLNPVEGRLAIDALTDFLRRRLGRQTIASLIDGTETFESLGITQGVDEALKRLEPITVDQLLLPHQTTCAAASAQSSDTNPSCSNRRKQTTSSLKVR